MYLKKFYRITPFFLYIGSVVWPNAGWPSVANGERTLNQHWMKTTNSRVKFTGVSCK